MRGVFDGQEDRQALEPAQPKHDTELTLGPIMLLGIFFVLVLLCGLCFGLGYAAGHRSPQAALAATQPATGAQDTTLPAQGSQPKPSPTGQSTRQTGAAAQGGAPGPSTLDTSDTNAGSPGAEPDNSSLSQSQVRPALTLAPNPPEPAAGLGSNPKMQTSPALAIAPMVQIASVSDPEDAEVLVNALRRRGYAVTARRESADGLIHVRIGPFSSQDEANRWRQKLLNDGYNAIVQP